MTAAIECGSVVAAAPEIHAAALAYIEEGWQVVPLNPKSKKPKLKGWQTANIAADQVSLHFQPDDNIALLCGQVSGGLVDVDFDHPLAKQFAAFLPSTAMIHGRPGNPESHRWYRVADPLKTCKFTTPEGGMLVEIRSDEHATMVPPSVHPDGDQLQWSEQGEPPVIKAQVLQGTVAKIAAAALLAVKWPKKGARNDAALALAGALLRADWNASETADFICRVAKMAGDEEHQTRGECVEPTQKKIGAKEAVTGLPTLGKLMGEGVVLRLSEWLALDMGSGQKDQIDAAVEELNRQHALVSVGGRMWILNEITDPVTKQLDITFSKAGDFKLKYGNRTVADESGKQVSVAPVWLTHPERREYNGIEFAPESPQPGFFNLFYGFAVEPVPGDCSLYLGHLKDIICSGHEGLYSYVLSWMAHAVQHPGELPGTALVLRGAQGVGKGMFVEWFGRLFGQHYMALDRLSQVTGRFNGHLKNLLVVHANEAVWGGHKEAEGALKAMITEPMLAIEGKGKDIVQVQNFKRLIVASNEQWAVPLDLDDRRFLILDVSPAHKEDHGYFAALDDQMKQGGLKALMHGLRAHDLTGFNVRKLPTSKFGFDIKMASALASVKWWFDQLTAGANFCGGAFEKSVVHASYLDWCAKHKKHHVSELAQFCKELQKLVPSLKTEKKTVQSAFPPGQPERKAYFVFPPEAECRKAFETATKSGPEIWE